MINGLIKALSLLVATTCLHAWAHDFPLKPNPALTQGDFCSETDEDFAEYRYQEKIPYCARKVSGHTKSKIYFIYGISKACRHEYTIDHFIPLSVGGSNQVLNLWPEHKNVKATRRRLEQEVFWGLKRGELTQEEAVEIIVHAKMNPPAAAPSDCRDR